MTDAIRIENLSKRYRIGQKEKRPETLAGALASWLRAPIDNYRHLRSLSHFSANGNEPDVIWALRDVSFNVVEGEVVGIIGRNGAGKSTLLKILSRITPPTTGRIVLNGRVASLLEVGTGFHPDLPGRENIYLNGTILGMPKAEIDRKFDEIVAFSGVEKFIDTPIKRYSSGMKVRLAFAVAAHLEPEILLIDEVLAVGDAEFQKKCLGKMEDVARQGRTVLFVSHNMGAINALCKRTAFIKDGWLQALGPTAEVVGTYMAEWLQQDAVTNLDSLRDPEMGHLARFTEINLLSRAGSQIYFGEDIEIACTVRGQERVRNLSLGISLFNMNGVCIGTYFTRETFTLRPDETRHLRLRVSNLKLAPGNYYAALSLGQGGGHTGRRHDLDVIEGAPSFEVLQIPGENGGENIVRWHPNWGNIVLTDTELFINEAPDRPAPTSEGVTAAIIANQGVTSA